MSDTCITQLETRQVAVTRFRGDPHTLIEMLRAARKPGKLIVNFGQGGVCGMEWETHLEKPSEHSLDKAPTGG